LIIQALNEAKQNPKIKNINLLMNTPGGYVDQVDSVWNAIYNLRRSKRITAYNQGMIASAGYYIASAANEIISENPINQVGSIGVQYTEVDYTEFDQKKGIKELTFRSSNAKYKNISAATDEGADSIQEKLDAIEDVMLRRIATGRNVSKAYVINNYGQGAMFLSKSPRKEYNDALTRGMVDRVNNSKFNFNADNNKGKNKMSENENKRIRSLETLYDEFPETERLVTKAINEACNKLLEDTKAEYKSLASFLLSDDYNRDKMRTIVANTLDGKTSVETAIGIISIMDKEQAQEQIAAVENSESNSTESTVSDEQPNQVNNGGIITSIDDIKRERAKLENTRGGY
jgi:ClpP class serine protease